MVAIIHHKEVSCIGRTYGDDETSEIADVTCESCIATIAEDGCVMCGVCGEFADPVNDGQGVAEFVDANGQHVIAHADCGLERKYALA